MKHTALVFTLLFLLLFSHKSFATASSANILSLNTASTNVTTSAFVQLSASTPITTSTLIVANGTSSIIKVAVGASGSEVAYFAVGGSSTLQVKLGTILLSSARISLEAVDATASSGYITVSLLQ